MSRLPLTPEQAERSDRIYHALRQAELHLGTTKGDDKRGQA